VYLNDTFWLRKILRCQSIRGFEGGSYVLSKKEEKKIEQLSSRHKQETRQTINLLIVFPLNKKKKMVGGALPWGWVSLKRRILYLGDEFYGGPTSHSFEWYEWLVKKGMNEWSRMDKVKVVA
jgi:hypothetical protein